MIRLLAVILTTSLLASTAQSHDSWINRGGYRNQKGEHCCGAKDCFIERAQHVSRPRAGYLLWSGEFVEERQVLPSEDGEYWVCRDEVYKRVRCFFAPMEGL